MIATSNRTMTYSHDNYFVDIVTTGSHYEAWIYRDDYFYRGDKGRKRFMFGRPKDQQSYFDFMELVTNSIGDYEGGE